MLERGGELKAFKEGILVNLACIDLDVVEGKNAWIFKNQFKNYDEVVDDIKALSWCWSLSRLRIASCLFYEWCWNL